MIGARIIVRLIASMDRRLLICAAVSLAGHFAFARGLDYLPPRERLEDRIVQIRVVETQPAPEPEPEKQPEPPPKQPDPQPEVHEKPRPQPIVANKQAAEPVDTPPVDHSPTTNDTTTTPVYGVTLESTSQGSRGPAMPVGNTTSPAPTGNATAPVKPLAEPAAAFEVTKMPMPQGRCSGKYSDEARAAAIEGVVVLDLIVDETGHTRDITVVEGLAHGLTGAAIAALKACTFTPGEKAGKPVSVRVRGFKIRFVMQDAQ
jgi:protein TonB